MKRTLIALFVFCFCVNTYAQDRHFSQFYASPLTINPAMTGIMDGKYRAAISYRNQWGSILDEPFVTSGVAFDGSFDMGYKSKAPDKIGAGVYIFSDRVGQSDFTVNQVMLSGSFIKSLDYKGRHYLSGGYQVGLLQHSINYSSLTFADQFDGTTGYTFATGEELPINNVTNFDMAGGLFWMLQSTDDIAVYAGGSVHHFNKPVISFYEGIDDINQSQETVKFIGQFGLNIRTDNRLVIEPRALVLRQGEHMELNTGANFKIVIDDFVGNYLYLGGWLRSVSDNENSLVMDAVIANAALQLQNVQVGVSYDINLSNLAGATAGRGGLEFSLIFLGNYENDNVICPKF